MVKEYNRVRYRDSADTKISDDRQKSLGIESFDIDKHDIYYDPELERNLDSKLFFERIIVKNEAKLPKSELDILTLRYFPYPQGLEEVGRHLEMGRERVRQMECKAIERIRQYLAETNFKKP